MTGTTQRQLDWRLRSLLLGDHVALAAVAWICLVGVVSAFVVGTVILGEVTGSAWDVGTNLAPWYVAFIGGLITFQTLPLFVATGRTRRATFADAVIVLAVLATVVAALMTLGFVIESWLFGLTGWPLEPFDGRLFASHADLHLIFVSSLATYVVWIAGGALLGSAIYRYGSSGWVALAPAIVLAGGIGMVTQPVRGPFGIGFQAIDRLLEPLVSATGPLGVMVALFTSVIGASIALALAWLIVRDVPIRAQQ